MGYIYLAIFVLVAFYAVADILYRGTDYYKTTHKWYPTVIFNTGNYGEYLTYKKLRSYENEGAKFLYNCYLPRENGGTTEIDVLMIHCSGIYVFESKNYSGWIFGSENQKMWTQSLPSGRRSHKEHFLNPIMQNKLHIKWLINQIGQDYPIHSVIVFSERCELKKVSVKSDDIKVVKRNVLKRTVQGINGKVGARLSQEQIWKLYDQLYPFTQVSQELKDQHVQNILENHKEMSRGTVEAVPLVQEPIAVEGPVVGKPEVFASASESVKEEEGVTSTPAEPVVEEVDEAVVEVSSEEMVAQETTVEEKKICPRCGGELILRKSTKGTHKGNQFYGCGNFPKCRYIENIGE